MILNYYKAFVTEGNKILQVLLRHNLRRKCLLITTCLYQYHSSSSSSNFLTALYISFLSHPSFALGGFIPELAEVCLAAVNAFNFPCAINMYLTNAGQKTSAPPHTDKQVGDGRYWIRND